MGFPFFSSFALLNNKCITIIIHIPFATATPKTNEHLLLLIFIPSIFEQVKQFQSQCTVPTFYFSPALFESLATISVFHKNLFLANSSELFIGHR